MRRPCSAVFVGSRRGPFSGFPKALPTGGFLADLDSDGTGPTGAQSGGVSLNGSPNGRVSPGGAAGVPAAGKAAESNKVYSKRARTVRDTKRAASISRWHWRRSTGSTGPAVTASEPCRRTRSAVTEPMPAESRRRHAALEPRRRRKPYHARRQCQWCCAAVPVGTVGPNN